MKNILIPLLILFLLHLSGKRNDQMELELQYDDHVTAYANSLWEEILADRMDTASED